MIVILRHNVTDEKRDQLINWFKSQGLGVDVSKGEYQTILGLIGDVLSLDTDMIESLDIVQATRRVTEPFKRCNRKFQPDDTIVTVGGASIGGGNFAFIAGPSSIESEEQLLQVAASVKESGTDILTGGSISSKTPRHNVQKKNLAELEHLKKAKQDVGMPAGKELISVEDIPNYKDLYILIIGERNMCNYPLLAAAAESGKTIILKRSVSATLEELLMSAEYIMAGGNKDIILCERGLRTFTNETKATFDISAIPLLKEMTHLPVIADVSRSTGLSRLVRPLSLAACAAGADGLMIDVHNDPGSARRNGGQAISTEAFGTLAQEVRKLREAMK
jgi:3-deoxy-7-phosphoheptulonate synthase